MSCSSLIPDGIYSFESNMGSVYVFHDSEFVHISRFDLSHIKDRGKYKIKNRSFYFYYDSVSYKNVFSGRDSSLHFFVYNPSVLLIDGETHTVRKRKFTRDMIRLDSLPPVFNEGEIEFLKNDLIYNRKFQW